MQNMKPWGYYSDYQASKMVPATLDSALADVCDIAAELTRYSGKLGDFAYSMDALDKIPAEMLRAQGSLLAWNVVVGNLSDNEIAQIHAAFAFVCKDDEYAAKEIAGRFLSAVRRIRVVRAIGRRRDHGRFTSLCEAISKGRFTAKQWAFAVVLAKEAPPEMAQAA